MSPKTLPASVLMPEYESLLRQGAELPLVVSGESMLPFLRPGLDTVYLRAAEMPLRRGDVAFYRRADGSYVLHRVFRAEAGRYWFLGDAQSHVEGPLDASCVFAYVSAVRRGDAAGKPRLAAVCRAVAEGRALSALCIKTISLFVSPASEPLTAVRMESIEVCRHQRTI